MKNSVLINHSIAFFCPGIGIFVCQLSYLWKIYNINSSTVGILKMLTSISLIQGVWESIWSFTFLKCQIPLWNLSWLGCPSKAKMRLEICCITSFPVWSCTVSTQIHFTEKHNAERWTADFFLHWTHFSQNKRM